MLVVCLELEAVVSVFLGDNEASNNVVLQHTGFGGSEFKELRFPSVSRCIATCRPFFRLLVDVLFSHRIPLILFGASYQETMMDVVLKSFNCLKRMLAAGPRYFRYVRIAAAAASDGELSLHNSTGVLPFPSLLIVKQA